MVVQIVRELGGKSYYFSLKESELLAAYEAEQWNRDVSTVESYLHGYVESSYQKQFFGSLAFARENTEKIAEIMQMIRKTNPDCYIQANINMLRMALLTFGINSEFEEAENMDEFIAEPEIDKEVAELNDEEFGDLPF